MHLIWWSDAMGPALGMLALALACSAVIGMERQFRRKSAGLRTHALVALGSAAFTLVSSFGFAGIGGDDVSVDPTRIAAQVVSGIGFLGAGVIFMRHDVVRGLTTAASIWVSAAVGMACGAGMPTLAIGAAVAHLVITAVMTPLGRRMPQQHRGRRLLALTYQNGRGVLRDVLRVTSEMGAAVTVRESSVGTGELDGTATVVLEMRSGPALDDLLEAIDELDGVTEVHATQ